MDVWKKRKAQSGSCEVLIPEKIIQSGHWPLFFLKMQQGYIESGELQLEYFKWPGGERIMLAFNGYGRDASEMALLHRELGDVYTVYAVNFFHHGKSVYPDKYIDKNTLQPDQWNQIIHSFLQKEKIEELDLFGYSMGGKLILTMLPEMNEKIGHLFLLAPDGLKENFWYRTTSRNKVGKGIYKRIIRKPEPFFKTMSALRRMRLLHPHLDRFVKFNLETEDKRKMVYNVWMTLRYFRPDLKKAGRTLSSKNISLDLFMGKYDKVIPPSLGKRLIRQTNAVSQLHVLECGHNLLAEKSLKEICALMRQRITGQ